MGKLTLYGYIMCPFVHRVRFALESLKISYDYYEVDLFRNAQKSEEYLKINPLAKVPSISYKGGIIFESLALLEFIENEFGGVFPKDNMEKARQRIWVSQFEQNITSKFYAIVGQVKAKNQAGANQGALELMDNIKQFTFSSGLFRTIKDNPNSHFGGERLSYADYAMIPHTRCFDAFFKIYMNNSFQYYSEQNELTQAFRTFSQNGIKTNAFNVSVDRLQVIPPRESCSILISQKDFDYDSIFKLHYQKKLTQ